MRLKQAEVRSSSQRFFDGSDSSATIYLLRNAEDQRVRIDSLVKSR